MPVSHNKAFKKCYERIMNKIKRKKMVLITVSNKWAEESKSMSPKYECPILIKKRVLWYLLGYLVLTDFSCSTPAIG